MYQQPKVCGRVAVGDSLRAGGDERVNENFIQIQNKA